MPINKTTFKSLREAQATQQPEQKKLKDNKKLNQTSMRG
jgi:hypothetical protein